MSWITDAAAHACDHNCAAVGAHRRNSKIHGDALRLRRLSLPGSTTMAGALLGFGSAAMAIVSTVFVRRWPCGRRGWWGGMVGIGSSSSSSSSSGSERGRRNKVKRTFFLGSDFL